MLGVDFHLKIATPPLKSRGISCCIVRSKSLLDAPQNIHQIGKFIGREDKAFKLAKKVETKINHIIRKARQTSKKVRVCYICDVSCLAWRSCAMGRLIEVLGGINIGNNIKGKEEEAIYKQICLQDPEVIITARRHRERINLLSFVKKSPYFRNTQAYRKNRIYRINAEFVCRPGLRAAIGLESLAKFIHPEIFR